MFKCYLPISVFWWRRWSSKSVTALMTVIFIEYPLMISPGNVNLDKIKLKNLISFKLKFYCMLFYTLLAIFFIYKKY